MRRRLLFPLLALLGALVSSSCLSPTLPLPPPEQPDSIKQNADGTFAIAGQCQPGALVTVFDNNKGLGRVVEDRSGSGRYAIDIIADKCDVAWVTQEFQNETSSETLFVVQEHKAGDPTGGTCQ